ncbi:hypothetical protein CgunFtcFv8_026945 [Champsocephalus gunnari]|uniref:Ubiquitin-like domain-containing protein n=1 Tax=Champsocephalus gunnari TaxID=52237 RepID=A0AAN8I0Z5_CHAGU|nr:hypothetical protein CgunFtcFv8_026945 [Champsocephalus gunnari]
MRVLICFGSSCEPFDISPNQTVGAIKQMIKDNFLVQLSDDKQHQYLELSYGGAALRENWTLCDVGITRGSAIRCLIKSERRPVMRVFNAVTGKTLPIMGSDALLNMSIARLKSVVSMQSGLPVGTFRLSTPEGMQLYDCNQLQDYAIVVGTTLRLDTWDGWVEFLLSCLLGHRLTVQIHLSEKKPLMRFQLQVALYIAASSGHLDLAGWLLERGVHADKPVGVHPYRQWCQQTAHRDTGKCPIHIAVERNHLLILKLFITKNLLSLTCRDPGGRDPLKVAIQHGSRDCVQYLANKLCSVVSLSTVSLPMRIYLQLKRWVSLGQKGADSNQCQYSAAFKARVGDKLLVDGFNQPYMSSKSRKTVTIPSRGIKAKALQPLPPISNLLSHLPSLGDFKEMQTNQKQDVKSKKACLLDGICQDDSSLLRKKCILPPISRDRVPRPTSPHILTASLKSSTTPREKATYYLTVASNFTEKPWLKQLSIARTLIRKRVHTMA